MKRDSSKGKREEKRQKQTKYLLKLKNVFQNFSGQCCRHKRIYLCKTLPVYCANSSWPSSHFETEFISVRRLKSTVLFRCQELPLQAVYPPFSAEIRVKIISHNAYGANNTCAVTLNESRWRTSEKL